ncbi:uncharacterized protein KRP23_4587 [Phytophthora ramorum]|uniref:uncharacterized protein n=1 Tax=Phytophthora ramorum TaxID=164328 RepID=UPI0030B78A03|nr:hypothetical protein KRP23_4587 [Phytophthora ramorum]
MVSKGDVYSRKLPPAVIQPMMLPTVLRLWSVTPSRPSTAYVVPMAEKKPHQVKFWESNALLAAATGGHGDLVVWMYLDRLSSTADVFHGFYMQSNQEVMGQLTRHGDMEAV